MRSAALALLAALSPGCNQVFGLDETVPAPDAPVIDPAAPFARLTYLVATTDMMGAPIAQPTTPAIVPAPMVKIGLLDGALTNVAYTVDGKIEIPDAFLDQPWRLVYQLVGDIPREVQWKPARDRGHMIVPRFGRIDPAPVPSPQSGYTVTPTGVASYQAPRLFTTGVWMEGAIAAQPTPTVTFNVGQSSFAPLAGIKGAPEVSKGDLQVLVDYGPMNGCRRATGFATFAVDLIATGPSSPAMQPAWGNDSGAITVTGAYELQDAGRVATQFGASDPTMLPRRGFIGYGPTTALPLFHLDVGAPIPAPVMVRLLDCTNPTGATGWETPFSDVAPLSNFYKLASAQITASRMSTSGVAFAGGITAVTTGNTSFALDFRVPFATNFRIDGADLATGADAKPIAGGSAPLRFEFDLEMDAGTAAYFEVTLHKVTTSYEPVHAFTVTEESVAVDRGLLTQGDEYVFEVRAYRGANVDIKDGDFTRYTSSQAMTSIFSRTFIAP